MGDSAPMAPPAAVAMTLTQDWHAVPGGTATAANSLAATLDRDPSVDIRGVVPAGGQPDPAWRPPVPTVSLRLGLPWLYDAWHHLRRPRVTSASGPVDLVHLTIPIAPPPERVPVVATVHDLLPLTMPEMFNRRGVKLMTRGLARIREEAAVVMVPTRTGVGDFEAQGFDRGRLRVVPLGVDEVPAPAPGAVEEAMARHGLEPPYVLFVGTAEPRKGLDVLVEAMDRIARTELTLALAGPEGWGDDVEPALAGLGDRVRRLGFVPSADLPLLRRGAGACCSPSRAEGFGLPVLEAMAAGAPVVTTEGTPMAEFAEGVARLVPVGDATALAEGLCDVLDDRDLAEEMRRSGVLRAADYSWERTADAVIAVYAEVLGR